MTNSNITKEQVDQASKAWAEARALVRESIRENQAAMAAFRVNKNQETEAQYKATKQAHKEAIDHIKEVRNQFYQLKYAFETQQAA
jgi:hypothetical protein